jgi:hypothetical protein
MLLHEDPEVGEVCHGWEGRQGVGVGVGTDTDPDAGTDPAPRPVRPQRRTV